MWQEYVIGDLKKTIFWDISDDTVIYIIIIYFQNCLALITPLTSIGLVDFSLLKNTKTIVNVAANS